MSKAQDKQAEALHNRRIFGRAEEFWSWGGSAAGERRGQRRIDQYVQHLSPCEGKYFLEYGCGMGWFTQRMKDFGARIAAFDIQKEFADVAKRRAEETTTGSSHVSFIVADSEFLPFAAGAFDGAYGTSILHHVPMDTTLRELYRVLKPGAKIIYSEPNMLNPQIMIMKNVRWVGERMGESPNETAFFKWQIRSLLRRAGFSQIHVEPFDFLHPSIPQRLIPMAEGVGRFSERVPVVREIAGSLDIRAEK